MRPESRAGTRLWRRINLFSFAHIDSNACLTLKSEAGGELWTGFMRHIHGS